MSVCGYQSEALWILLVKSRDHTPKLPNEAQPTNTNDQPNCFLLPSVLLFLFWKTLKLSDGTVTSFNIRLLEETSLERRLTWQSCARIISVCPYSAVVCLPNTVTLQGPLASATKKGVIIWKAVLPGKVSSEGIWQGSEIQSRLENLVMVLCLSEDLWGVSEGQTQILSHSRITGEL